jgi:Domain of unknown function (DUF1707)/Domain of unknown function (DUF4190)
MRSSSADRERAIDVLKAAFAEGRLTKDEFDERAGQVYSSRTYAELDALTADVPAGPLGALPLPQARPLAAVSPGQVMSPPGRSAVPPGRPMNSLAVASLICALIPGITGIGAVATGIIARRQIRETGERGAGLAAAGIVIGTLSMLVILLYLAAAIAHS